MGIKSVLSVLALISATVGLPLSSNAAAPDAENAEPLASFENQSDSEARSAPNKPLFFSNDGYLEKQSQWTFVQPNKLLFEKTGFAGREAAILARNDRKKPEPNGLFHTTLRVHEPAIARPGDTVWIGFSVYLPSDKQYGLPGRFIHQIHQSGAGGWKSDVAHIHMMPEHGILEFYTAPANRRVSLGKFKADEWIDFVIEYKLSANGNGYINLWVNGNRIDTGMPQNINTLFSGKDKVHFSFENYSFFPKDSPYQNSALYISNVRIAKHSNFACHGNCYKFVNPSRGDEKKPLINESRRGVTIYPGALRSGTWPNNNTSGSSQTASGIKSIFVPCGIYATLIDTNNRKITIGSEKMDLFVPAFGRKLKFADYRGYSESVRLVGKRQGRCVRR